MPSADVLAVVDHRHPEPQHVGAALLHHVLRRDGVAERLRHLAALLVDDEAVREHLIERRAAARADADEQRAVEPAAVLVATLRDRCPPASAAPSVAAAPPRGSTPSRTTRRGCSTRARTRVPPHDGAGRGRRARTPRSAARTRRRRRARRTRSPRDRSAPWSAPAARTSCSRAPGSAHPRRAGARCTSRAGARSCCRCGRGPTTGSSASRRSPRARARAGSARLHRDEPLRRRQEDHRVVAAPAVRIRVVVVLAMPQPAALGERRFDLRVGVEHLQAARTARPSRGSGRRDRAGRRSRGRT